MNCFVCGRQGKKSNKQSCFLKPRGVFCVIMKKRNSTLDALFLDQDSPYALSGNVEELLAAAQMLGVPRKTTQTYLRGEPTFTLHRPQRQRFLRSKTVVGPTVDHTWQADLVEMQDPKLVQNNRRTRYLLTVIDVLSEYAWVVGLKSKRGTAVRDALRHLLENDQRRPVKLQTDQGKKNGCWTSVASITIPLRANPKPLWPSASIARSKNSPTST